MRIGTSIFLIAVGAILRFAVTTQASGFNIHTAGTILLVVGITGLVISLLLATMWADRRGGTVVRDRAVVQEPVVRERDVY